MKKIQPIIVTITTAMVLTMNSPAMAENRPATQTVKPLELRNVMSKLSQDMQGVLGAISKEDWQMVAALAPKIADHAEPPLSEKVRILSWLGSDAGKFRGFDGQAHDAATAMGEAAKRRDGQAVIAAFAKVQQSCLGCHQSFRQPFLEHFYGSR